MNKWWLYCGGWKSSFSSLTSRVGSTWAKEFFEISVKKWTRDMARANEITWLQLQAVNLRRVQLVIFFWTLFEFPKKEFVNCLTKKMFFNSSWAKKGNQVNRSGLGMSKKRQMQRAKKTWSRQVKIWLLL